MARLPETVPEAAQYLLAFIMKHEAPRGFDTIFGNRQDRLETPITQMRLGELIDQQKKWSSKAWVKANWGIGGPASSAAGGLQFMRDTLIGLARRFPQDLDGKTIFTPTLQLRLGYQLLLDRGFQKFVDGQMALIEFGKGLAMEWASFPVLADCAGAHRTVRKGQSYYAGDGVNKALVPPWTVAHTLREVLRIANARADVPVPIPRPEPPDAPEPPPVAPPLDHEKPPVNVDPEKLDKPLARSKTVWMWILTALGSAGSSLAGIFSAADWRVQMAMLGVLVMIFGFAVYAIKRRGDLARVVRGIKAEIGDV